MMKNRIYVSISCLLLVSLLFGCDSAIPSISNPPANIPQGKIVFESWRDHIEEDYGEEYTISRGSEVYVMDTNGDNQVRLTFTQFGGSRQPKWTPDGNFIIYREDYQISGTASDPYNQLMIMQADGSGQQPLTKEIASRWWDTSPYENMPSDPWMRAIHCNNGLYQTENFQCLWISNDDIYIFDIRENQIAVDGNNLTNTPAAFESDPIWSPDGSEIAFSSNKDSGIDFCRNISTPDSGGGYDIFIMNSDGSNKKNLTMTNEIMETNPSWSPDKGWLVFTSQKCTGAKGELAPQIFMMRRDGSNMRQLTDTIGSNASPAWQPQ